MRNDFYVGYYNDSVYLAHHGILGMHWGRRNGPPYPLDAADHSQSEKKAGWRKSLAKGGQAFGKVGNKVAKHTVHNFTKANTQNYKSGATEDHRKKKGENSRQYQNSRDFDKKISEKYAEDNVNKGKKFVKNLLMSPTLLQTYNMSRAAGEGRGKAFVRTVLDVNIGSLVGAAMYLPTAGVGRVLSDQVEKAFKNSGTELSLQQRAIRKKYIKNTAPKKLTAKEGVSKTTQNAIKEYNSLSDEEFKKKYQVDKNTYAKRVEKYGDPYMNSPMAKAGKKLRAANQKRLDSAAKAAQKDADDLRKYGYTAEADAVQKVADENKRKAKKAKSKR